MELRTPGRNTHMRNSQLGQYHLRVRPEFKDKLAFIQGCRKIEGITDANKYTVAEEAIDKYYNELKAKYGNIAASV